MILNVVFIGAAAPGCVQRLHHAGVPVFSVPVVEEVAATIQACNLQADQLLVVGGKLQGAHAWEDVFSQTGPPSCEQIMQAIVQHNRRSMLNRAAASTAQAPDAAAAHQQPPWPSSVDQQQQQQQQALPTPPPVLVVGYVMKQSREEQLASAGLLPLLPMDGVCFMPFDVGRLTHAEQQQGHIDILLHKGSDELVPAPDGSVRWSHRVTQLQAWLAGKPHICVVDPFPNTAKVLDRGVLMQLMEQLQHLQLPGRVTARAPRHCLVNSFTADGLQAQLTGSGMMGPFIVKPVVACGVAHSHCMALALQPLALKQLQGQVPLPAVVQEFVNHGGTQWKVYVLDEKVFVTPRASIPDVHIRPDLPPEQQVLLFDSLASLPTQLPAHMASPASVDAAAHSTQQKSQQQPDQVAVEAIAAFLQTQLGLTLFGFDVVVVDKPCSGSSSSRAATWGGDQGSELANSREELIIIDINYFPNYKGGSNTPALLRQALVQCWQRHTAALQQRRVSVMNGEP